MFDTPYQTTPCSRFVLDRIISGIRRLEIDNSLVNAGGVPGLGLVAPGAVDFMPFNHFITKIDAPTLAHDVVGDGRSLLRPDGTVVRKDTFDHTILTGKLIRLWALGNDSTRHGFLSVGDFATKSFAAWVTQAIVLRLGLDFGQSAILSALTTIYYLQLHHTEEAQKDPAQQDRVFVRASRTLARIDPITLRASLGDIPPLNDIQDYIDWVKKVLNSPRVEQLTVGFLYIALGASYGPAYREHVAVALEYPPTFIAMVYSAVNDRGYSKTGLGKTVEKLINRDNHKEFVKNVNHLTQG